jgi:hypothetical protein
MRHMRLLALCCASAFLGSCSESTAPTAQLSIHGKRAGHAVVIPRGSVTVDGTIGTVEWGNALLVPLTVPLSGGTSAVVDLRLVQDRENLYASARVPLTGIAVVLGVTFDNDRNGAQDVGEDEVFAGTTGVVADGIAVAGGRENDQFLGGTLDVTAGWRTTTNAIEIELSHPLNSGDIYDIAVGNNGKLSATLLVSLLGLDSGSLGFRYYPGGISPAFGAFRVARH